MASMEQMGIEEKADRYEQKDVVIIEMGAEEDAQKEAEGHFQVKPGIGCVDFSMPQPGYTQQSTKEADAAHDPYNLKLANSQDQGQESFKIIHIGWIYNAVVKSRIDAPGHLLKLP